MLLIKLFYFIIIDCRFCASCFVWRALFVRAFSSFLLITFAINLINDKFVIN